MPSYLETDVIWDVSNHWNITYHRYVDVSNRSTGVSSVNNKHSSATISVAVPLITPVDVSNASPSGRVGSVVQLVISPAPETVGVVASPHLQCY